MSTAHAAKQRDRQAVVYDEEMSISATARTELCATSSGFYQAQNRHCIGRPEFRGLHGAQENQINLDLRKPTG